MLDNKLIYVSKVDNPYNIKKVDIPIDTLFKNEIENNDLADYNNSLSWDQYFMAIAKVAAMRSKDPCTKVGACIVKHNKIISTGYNGMPNGCKDNVFPWSKNNSNEYNNKYFYVVHAELNAILNASKSVKKSTLYVTKFPCNECAKAIIQSKIKKVIYLHDEKDINDNDITYTKNMFKAADIEVEQYINKYNIFEITV